MSSSKNLTVEQKDRIYLLTINNPEKRNVLSEEILISLSNELKEPELSGKAGCIIITGTGKKAFSSGYDISAIGDNDMMRDYSDDHPLQTALDSIENCPVPVIAMMNGHAFGAGLELAVTCDIRICADDAKLAMPPSKLGVTYTYSGIRKFLNLIGTGYTKEMFLTGDTIDAYKAERIGLVNHIVNINDLNEFTYDLAYRISENAPLSMKTMKMIINLWQEEQRLDTKGESVVRSLIENVQNSSDYKEGRNAFREKRKPDFKGK